MLSFFDFRSYRTPCLFLCLSVSLAWTSVLPLFVGVQMETGYGLLQGDHSGVGVVRLAPILGAYLPGIGYTKLGYSWWRSDIQDSTGSSNVEQKDFSIQLASTLGSASSPYLLGSYTRADRLSPMGDVTWNEWGLGLGSLAMLSPNILLLTEFEYRWIGEHYDPMAEQTLDGTRIQVNLGLVFYLY